MTFLFDKWFLNVVESNSKKFNKTSVVILFNQSQIVLVQTQNILTSHKNP